MAAAVSVVLALISRKTPRGRPANSRSLVIAATCLPVISAGYVFTCAFLAFPVLIPGETEFLFGDILEPLPNGYALKAMGKMSDYGSVVATSASRPTPKLKSAVCSLSVEGPIVFGKYSHPFGQEQDIACRSNEGYFALDTRNADVHDFSSMGDLERFVRHPVQLVSNANFHSTVGLSARRGWRMFELAIALGPPLIGFVLFFTSMVRHQRSLGSNSS